MNLNEPLYGYDSIENVYIITSVINCSGGQHFDLVSIWLLVCVCVDWPLIYLPTAAKLRRRAEIYIQCSTPTPFQHCSSRLLAFPISLSK